MTKRSMLTPFALLIAASAMMAQDTSGTLSGKATTRDGKAIAGAVIRIASPKLLGERTTVSDSQGQFRIPLLPTGDYTFVVTANGFLGKKGNFQILAGQTMGIVAAMTPVNQVEAVVVVTATVAQADKTDTVTQTNFSAETLNQIVTPDLANFSILVPGINKSLTDQGNLNIRGGTGHSTKTLLNGATVTEEGGGYVLEMPTLTDMIESMSVIQSPMNARYGNTDGGIVSVVTTRGSNTFAGTIRASFSRPFWTTTNPSYADRNGVSNLPSPKADDATKRYDITIKGPLWKDHITFAYGGKLTPTSTWVQQNQRLQSDIPQPTDPNGIFFRDPANGNVIRKTNLWGQNADFKGEEYSQFNQFIVFAQITPNHQLEWNYTQSLDAGRYGDDYHENLDAPPGNLETYPVQVWNLAYKGIIGNRGVLEARFGRTHRAWEHPFSGTPAIHLQTYSTYTPNPDGSYASDSLLSGFDNGAASFNTYGYPFDKGDSVHNISSAINYQHVLELKGTHLIDVGYQGENFQWNTQSNGNPLQFWIPGMIASDLTAGDIYNADPSAIRNPGAYAGRYIVFNYAALLSNLDPTFGNAPILDSPYEGLTPRMQQLSGNAAGYYNTDTKSIYVNDLWSINQHHSVMGGLRVDFFKAYDTVKTMVKYNLPTLRFEYKWDIKGDQSQVVNFSYGQFHTREPGSLFYAMAQGRLGNVDVKYWNQGSASPYLVTREEILNPANYGYQKSQVIAAAGQVADPSWKAPVSTEINLGFRRNLESGGYWRLTAISKTWKNLFDFYPGPVTDNPNPGGAPILQRVLRNSDEFTRTYKSVEFEWMLPLTKALTFGGNYTFNRLMYNGRGSVDSPSRGLSSMWWGSFYDTFQSRGQYMPSRLLNPEHYFKWYLNYDLTKGRVRSNLSLHGTYTTGMPTMDTMTSYIGRPTVAGYYNGTTLNNRTGLPTTLANYVNTQGTGQDIWDVAMRYNLEVPVIRTLVWFVNMNVVNPFNTRSLAGWSVAGMPSAQIIPANNTEGRPASNPYPYGWRSGTGSMPTYNGRQPGRSISFETGIRF
ncbi:MAG: carboxypeptidase regulatory-like domain-containing protein [Holophaga sp.]|nr:carboxypeptidase regulatory-like domain-containing protein [Holophaga sp.]